MLLSTASSVGGSVAVEYDRIVLLWGDPLLLPPMSRRWGAPGGDFGKENKNCIVSKGKIDFKTFVLTLACRPSSMEEISDVWLNVLWKTRPPSRDG